MHLRLSISLLVATSMSCGTAQLKTLQDANPYPLAVFRCAGGLQQFRIDEQRVIEFTSTLGGRTMYAKATAKELEDLATVLRSAEYTAARKRFPAGRSALVCAGEHFTRVSHAQGAFEVPIEPRQQYPPPIIDLLDLVQRIRDSHFGDEFEPLSIRTEP